MQNRCLQSLQTAASCTLPPSHPSVSLLLSFTPPTLRDQSSPTGLDRADIIVFATLSGSRESDATGAHCQNGTES